MSGAARGTRWLLCALLLGAFALRLWRLDAQSLWWDEGISLHLGTSPLPTLLADRLNNIHPPGYFLLLQGWLGLAGVSAFSARYLSTLASWLSVAALYGVARRGLGRATAVLAAFLGAIAAVSVIYAQEARVYALLPLIYLGLLGVSRELARGRGGWGAWLALAGLSWLGLHLHYIAFFAVAVAYLWLGAIFLRGGRRRDVRRLLLAGLLVALASLPWFLAALNNLAAVRGEADAGTFVTEAAPWPFLLAQVWAFHLTGLAGALARPWLAGLAAGTAVLCAALLLWRLAARETRRNTAVLLGAWLAPLSAALLVWLVRSFSHPRYVAMFVPGLLLLIAYLAWPGRARETAVSRLPGALLAAGVAAASLGGLWLYFTDAGAAKDDVRGAAAYLETAAGPEDLILVPDTDWSLPFEYGGTARVAMPGWETGAGWQTLARLTADAPRVFVLDYPRGTRDWQDRLPYALAAAGRVVGEEAFAGVTVRAYDLARPLSAPALRPATADFGPLRLTGAALGEAVAGAPLAVALRWQAVDPAALAGTRAALRLWGPEGWEVAAADRPLLDENGRPPEQWAPGQEVTTYHLLPLPPGTPPLAFELGLRLFEEGPGGLHTLELRDAAGNPAGQEARLPGVTVVPGTREVDPADLPLPLLETPLPLAPGLDLAGYRVPAGEARAGQALAVALLWRGAGGLADLRPALALVQEGRDLVVAEEAPADGRYPTDQWTPGEWVWEQRALLVPPGSGGAAQIRLRLDETDVLLGEVQIAGAAGVFERPEGFVETAVPFGEAAILAGYDAPAQMRAGEAASVRLLWQAAAGGGATRYAVFVHLLDEAGRIIAQHDGLPADGARPTTGWVAGEYIVDAHDLVWRDAGYRGAARLVTGLYDPGSGARLALPDGGDVYELPLAVTVLPPP